MPGLVKKPFCQTLIRFRRPLAHCSHTPLLNSPRRDPRSPYQNPKITFSRSEVLHRILSIFCRSAICEANFTVLSQQDMENIFSVKSSFNHFTYRCLPAFAFLEIYALSLVSSSLPLLLLFLLLIPLL